ncbi:hypothetical protein D082_50440 (plasmid) [Synechocystis sp. PCC 6714]|nr:hypothetical protein D082_50440 [Synechocystis sp. PCC 6714]
MTEGVLASYVGQNERLPFLAWIGRVKQRLVVLKNNIFLP